MHQQMEHVLLERPLSGQAGETEVDKLSFELLVEVGEFPVSPGAEVPSGHIDVVYLQPYEAVSGQLVATIDKQLSPR